MRGAVRKEKAESEGQRGKFHVLIVDSTHEKRERLDLSFFNPEMRTIVLKQSAIEERIFDCASVPLQYVLSGSMKTPLTIGEYLIQRLYAYGVRHVFGIPGDYVLTFYDQLARSKLRTINTCDEQGAGFAADAYARVRGLGAVCVTYCVGG